MISSFPIIFLGDTHGFIDDFVKQKEIIDKINPDFILSESLQNLSLDSKEKYEEVLKIKKISEMVLFSEIENLIGLCYKKNIKLIGIDIENFGFTKELQEKINNNQDITREEEKKIEHLLNRREKHQIRMIKNFKNKTKKPIVVILGSWHLREDSPLMKSFNNYKVIFPCDKENKLLFEPPQKREDVFYCEREKWQN